MQLYTGTKQVKARPMNRADYNTLRGWQLPADEAGADEGYLVEYVDGGKANVEGYAGYVSWSPKDVFERAYNPCVERIQACLHSFGDILAHMKDGAVVSNADWNGRSMELSLQTLEVEGTLHKEFVLQTPKGSSIGWRPSKQDILSEKWHILHYPR